MKTSWMVIAAVMAGTGAAAAQSCEERAADLAAEYQLSAAPPVQSGAGRTGSDMSRDLARSGGVIAPPPTGDISTIEPPPSMPSDGMPTAPPVDPAPSAGDTAARQPGAAAAADLQAETLLQGALSAARDGDEAQCLERLAEAEQLLAER
jgi:hypothetical protein